MRIIRTETISDPQRDLTSQDDREWVYNGLDCCVTLEVLETIEKLLDNQTRATYEFSKALMAPILDMSMFGLRVDLTRRDEVLRAYRARIESISAQLNRIIAEGIGIPNLNWRSPLQLKRLFYEVLGCKEIRKRDAHGRMAPTVNREALEKLSDYFYASPITKRLLALRDIDKKRMFLETTLDPDNRIRTNFNIAGTNTGRLASSFSDYGTGTNLQNVDRELRSVFIADRGMKFANIDLEQADARNVGAICWELFVESLGERIAGAYLDACESGDLHTTVCSMAWNELPWTGDRKLDRGIADQIAYRGLSYRDLAKKLGHGCLTEDHEVLTPTGWVPIKSLPPIIMQWGEGKSEFVEVSNWTSKLYTGELQSFEGNSISALMTHDHRVPFKRDKETPYVNEAPAEAGPQRLMPLGSGYMGGSVKAHGQLMAAIISDGELTGNKTRFHFHKLRKRQRLIYLCQEAGVGYVEHSDGRVSINYSCQKVLGPWLFELTKETALDLLFEYRFWDGTIGDTSVTLINKSRYHLEWLQTLGRIYGIGGQIQKPQTSGFGSKIYRLQQNKRQYASGDSVKHTRIPVKNIEVFCPTVESGWFYVRRNGRIFVTGNTNYYGTPPTMAKHTKVQRDAIELFQAKYFKAFPAIKSWHGWVNDQLRSTQQITTLYGRRRHFFGSPTDQETLRAAIAYAPQSMTADQINTGMLNLWRANICQLLVQVHDSILIQYPEELEDEIVPTAIKLLAAPLRLTRGRDFCVPSDCKVGWNWGDVIYDKAGNVIGNPEGLMKYKGGDTRRRERGLFDGKKI